MVGQRRITPLPIGTLLKLCIPMVIIGLGAGLIIPFFQVYFQWRFGTSVEDIGILFATTLFLWAAAYLLVPGLTEKRGSVRAITYVHCGGILALLAIPVSPTFSIVSVAYIARMVLMNATWPILQSFSIGQMPDEHRSFTLSATNFSFNGAKAVTPLIGGIIYSYSLSVPFFICAVLYTASVAAFFLFFRHAREGVGRKRRRKMRVLSKGHQEDEGQ